MKKNIFVVWREANATLKPLGKILFYLYAALFLSGCAGMLFSLSTAIFKIAHRGSAVGTPWWEIAMLMIISYYMTRIFKKESLHLITMDEPKEKLNSNIFSITPPNPSAYPSNIIPFSKKKEM